MILTSIKRHVPGPIKRAVGNLLLRVNYSSDCKGDLNLPSCTLSEPGAHCFFGYYDISPFSASEQLLLATQTTTALRTPRADDELAVGFYDLTAEKREFQKVGTTETWCWQQGCRLRWDPAAPDTRIIYNKMTDGQYGSVIQDIRTGQVEHKSSFSLYDLASDGEHGLTLNFSRLQRLRPGYGYVNLPDDSKFDYCPHDDGVWLVDLQNDQKKLLFSLLELAAISPHTSMKNSQHYVNHLSFNPSGREFLFLHLWVDENNRRYSRLFTSDQKAGRLNLLNNTGLVSHYTWLSDERLLIVTRVTSLGKLRYVLYHYINGFEGITGDDHLIGDGHPTFIGNGKQIVTDTYPDEFRNQNILLYNRETNTIRVIQRCYVPPEYTGEVRCDLHPRTSPSGKLLCADVVVDGRRAMQVFDISCIQI